jgi:hypothetical protein
VQALSSAAGSYGAAEEASALLLQQVNASTETLIGRPLIGTGSAAGTGVADAAINDANLLIQRDLGIYNFRDWRGWAAFLLDYTWGFPGTALGYGVQAINAFYPNSGGYDPAFSALVGSHIYRGGIGLPGFATTTGNVTTHLGTGPGADDLMINHEEVHVWQNRIFGPLFQTVTPPGRLAATSWGRATGCCTRPTTGSAWSKRPPTTTTRGKCGPTPTTTTGRRRARTRRCSGRPGRTRCCSRQSGWPRSGRSCSLLGLQGDSFTRS